MMHTKLTLRLEDKYIRRAKKYAEKSGKSVSQIVADFFALLDAPGKTEHEELTPTVRSLVGALGHRLVSEEDYYRHLEEKYF